MLTFVYLLQDDATALACLMFQLWWSVLVAKQAYTSSKPTACLLPAARKQARINIGPDCHGTVQAECTQDHVHIILTALEIFWVFVYCLWFHKYILQEFRRLAAYVFSLHHASQAWHGVRSAER